jgi:hypothetical protein
MEKKDIMTFRRSLLASCALLLLLAPASIAVENPEVPVVDGHLGSCSVTFAVRDNEKKPIYNAKIHVVVRYGFLGLHKMSLEVGTNSEGKARVAGLPENAKKPFKFDVTSGRFFKHVLVDSREKCKSTIDVDLGTR